MKLADFVKRRGYNPTVIPSRCDGGPIVDHFPVVIPAGFFPSDVDGDQLDRRWDKKLCPGQTGDFRPRWGGGFFAPRGKFLHAAIDIMAAEGAPIIAPCAGTIPRQVRIGRELRPGAGKSKKGGNYLFLVDAHGWEWYFSHLRDRPKVLAGDHVQGAQLLGYVGRSGNASRAYGDGSIRGCPHLHLRLGKQLWTPGQAKKYDAQAALLPLYEAGAWRVNEV